MALRDDELLDFDASQMPNFDRAKAEEALREHGDVFRAQLVAARWLDNWRESVMRSASGPIGATWDPGRAEGIEYALLEVAAHLRQGELLPGGIHYEDQLRGRD